MDRLRHSAPWQLFAVLPRARRRLATPWWSVLGLRTALPAVLAVGTGVLIGAVARHTSLATPLVTVVVAFVLLQVLPPADTGGVDVSFGQWQRLVLARGFRRRGGPYSGLCAIQPWVLR